MSKIKVIIADDHALIREGIKKLLELEPGIEIAAVAADGVEALEAIDLHNPDVVLLDINMPNMNGIECLKEIKNNYKKVKVIMLMIHEDSEYLIKTINIGAEGYVLKDADVSSLIKAIHNVVAGEAYIHPSLSSVLVKAYQRKEIRKEPHDEVALTKREFEVICLISRGFNNKEIANELFISEKTVKNHVSNIFKKIKVNDRTQAALYAIKNNITKI